MNFLVGSPSVNGVFDVFQLRNFMICYNSKATILDFCTSYNERGLYLRLDIAYREKLIVILKCQHCGSENLGNRKYLSKKKVFVKCNDCDWEMVFDYQTDDPDKAVKLYPPEKTP
jgi:RNase P subunit RPR2